MYSETPPEKVTCWIGSRNVSDSNRTTPEPPAAGEPPDMASNRRLALSAASECASAGASLAPSSTLIQSSAAKLRSACYMKVCIKKETSLYPVHYCTPFTKKDKPRPYVNGREIDDRDAHANRNL